MNAHRSQARTRFLTRLTVAAVGTLVTLSASPALAADTPSSPAASSATSQEQVVPLVQPSVVYETITFTGSAWDASYDGEGKGGYVGGPDKTFTTTFGCTGFIVSSDGFVATAGHCVDMEEGKRSVAVAAAQWELDNFGEYYGDMTADELADYYVVDTADKTNSVQRAVTVELSESAGSAETAPMPARVVGAQKFENGDAALLQVNATGLNAVELSDGETPGIGADVVSVGFPGVVDEYADVDMVPTFNEGTISSTKTTGDGLYTKLQITPGLSHGMSGGPTVDATGQVVGINSAVVGDNSEGFGYLVPVQGLRELMADKGVEPELSTTSQAFQDGVRAFFDADKVAAVESLTVVTGQQPGNTMAADYLAKADALPDPTPAAAADSAPGASVPASMILASIGAAVALLLTLVGAIGWMVRRPRTQRGASQTAQYVAPHAAPAPTVPLHPAPQFAAPHFQAPTTPAPTYPAPTYPAPSRPAPQAQPALVGAPSMPLGTATVRRPAQSRPAPVGFTASRPLDVHDVQVSHSTTTPSCRQCGITTSPTASFCPACGSRVHS